MTNASALLLAADSWGGVAPMITLAEALHGLGVNARIAAYSDFSEKVRAAGCEFTDLGVSAAGFWAGQNAQRPDWASNPKRTLTALRSSMKAQAPAIAASLAEAAGPGEVIVSGTLTVALDDPEPPAAIEPDSRAAAPFPAQRVSRTLQRAGCRMAATPHRERGTRDARPAPVEGP